MARARDIDDVQVVFLDDPVQVGIDEIQPRRRAPVAEQARFDVGQLERLLQQRIVVEINLADREVVRRAPPGVQLVQQFAGLLFLWFQGSVLLFSPFVHHAVVENAAYRARNHQLFIRANDPHGNTGSVL